MSDPNEQILFAAANALHAAGSAINDRELGHESELKAAVTPATTAAEGVMASFSSPPEQSQGKHTGRFTWMKVAHFQNWLFEQNRKWRFTDGTLCVLWCVELPRAKDFTTRLHYVASTRTAYNNGKHSAPAPETPCVGYDKHGQPSVRSRAAKKLVDTVANQDWENFIYWAGRLTEHEEYGYEREYKLEIATRLAATRESVLAGRDDWAERLTQAFAPPNNLTSWRSEAPFLEWVAQHQSQARELLTAIWDGDDGARERMERFCALLPQEAVTGNGTRASFGSFLLLGVDATHFPFYKPRAYSNSINLVGYPAIKSKRSSETETYLHALGFLDRFIEEGRSRGLAIQDRLEAQGLVWSFTNEKLPASWSERDREAFYGYRGDTPSDSDEEGDPLDALAQELRLEPSNYLSRVKRLLEDKRQVIFHGPPGTGKTFIARKLATHLAGSKDRVRIVQFHPSYAYEDFVEGYRPQVVNDQPGFGLVEGPLRRMARDAAQTPTVTHILVIDEINRGNVAKVFGELYFLLEYRDEEMHLQYSAEPMSLPKNLWIIGTMNTADRSIALVDAALRRRFYFIPFFPDEPPIKGVLRRWLNAMRPECAWVADIVDRANALIDDRHAAIGPSYFMRTDLDEARVAEIWEHAVLPYLEEQFFGEADRLKDFDLARLRAAPVDEVAGEGTDPGDDDTDAD